MKKKKYFDDIRSALLMKASVLWPRILNASHNRRRDVRLIVELAPNHAVY
jgi:hypothetical protein